MTSSVEIRRWTKDLVRQRSDVLLRRRSLVLAPVQHVHRSIFFYGSSDKTLPRPRWQLVLLFAPLNLPYATWSIEIPVGRSTESGFADRLLEQFAAAIELELKPVSSIEVFFERTRAYRPHDVVSLQWELTRNPGHHACVLAALGRLREASAIAEEQIAPIPRLQTVLDEGRALLARRPKNGDAKFKVDWASHRLSALLELQRLAVLSRAGDRAGVAALLHEWERKKVRLREIEDIWQPTPFPLELGAGD